MAYNGRAHLWVGTMLFLGFIPISDDLRAHSKEERREWRRRLGGWRRLFIRIKWRKIH